MSTVNAKIIVRGMVQGVGYRWFADRNARKYDLTGFVENRPDGTVYLEVEGKKEWIEDYLRDLRKGPNLSKVDEVTVEWSAAHHLFINFKIKA
ncbi:MAG: acylphosphatase [Bacteroidetes bacterium]|nr:acylphosphatase [Bacteroidota bacterium]